MAALTAAWNTGSAASRGIACILIATLLFSIYGALTKWLAASYGPAQIIFFRGVFGFLPIAFLVYQAGGLRSLRSKHPVLQLVRGVCGLASNVCFILAYRQMPLADAFAIAYAAPIFVTVLSIPLLSERVGLHRWSAVAVGFMGVLIVTQPGSGVFGAPALLALAGTFLYALVIIATRRLGKDESAVCTMVYSTALFTLAAALVLPFEWRTPSAVDLGLFAALGTLGGVGMFLLVQAYRLAAAALIAPFDYTAMVWAAVLGFAIWGDVPSAATLTGIAVILASGLYIAHRETVRKGRVETGGAAAPADGTGAEKARR